MAKILHIGKYYFPASGGIESVTNTLAKGVLKFGHNVTVICFSKEKFSKFEVIDNVEIIRFKPFITIASQPISFHYLFTCLSFAFKSEIVHLHSPNILGALISLFIPKRIKLLVHWHSDVIKQKLFWLVFRPLEYCMLCRSNVVIATSRVYADSSLSLKPFRHKISVVPIGVSDVKFNQYDELKFSNEIATHIKNKRVILSVGRLVTYKGFNLLIEAVHYLPKNVAVVIVGSGPNYQNLQKSILDNNVSDRVLLAGGLCEMELHSLFKISNIFCLPSINRAEAFGVVLVEAMSFGLPIVAYDIPGSGVPWVNEHNVSGLNASMIDPKSLAEACRNILDSDELAIRFAKGSRKRYLKEFTEHIFLARIIKIYNKLLTC